MRLYEKIRANAAAEKKPLQDNREAVNNSNRNFFLSLMFIGAVGPLILYVLAYFVESFAPVKAMYLLIAAFAVASMLVVRFSRRAASTTWTYYILESSLAIIAALSSAFATPDYIGIMILIFIFEIPVMILDTPLRIAVYEVLVVAVYLCIVIPNKNPRLVPDEIINTTVFLIVGVATGRFIQHVRLKNLDLMRRLEIERTTDVLTGLSNRRKLFDYFAACEAQPTVDTAYAVALIDIDNFKGYNDSLGHLAGDHCLRSLGSCFAEFGEKWNMDFYRYGGDEFIGIVIKKPALELSALFDTLSMEISELHIAHPEQPDEFVSISAGIAPVVLTDGKVKFERLIEKADQALYQAKKQGRNRAVLYVGE